VLFRSLPGRVLSATLTLKPMGPKSVTLTPSPVVGGATVAGLVTLECPAGPGDIEVALTSTKGFIAEPTGRNWYRAHNASIVGAFLQHRDLADVESPPERFFMNVALVRVLYAHALVGAPRLALGRLAPLGRLLGDPRLGMAGVFFSLRRVLPNRYPLALDVERYIVDEQRLGRLLDYAVIVPRLQRIYEWSAVELGEPRLLELVRDGNPIYAWPFEERHVWSSPHMPPVGRALERVTRAR